MGDDERSSKVFIVDELVLLTFNLFRVSRLDYVTTVTDFTLEVGVLHEVSVTFDASIG